MIRSALMGCLVATLALGGCHREEQHAEEPVSFPVTSPLRRSTDLTQAYVARIRAIQHVDLRALERGYLQDTFVDEGQRVKRGDKMFQIQQSVYQAEWHKAKAELDRTKVELGNAKMLADKNIVSPNELALARANNDRAKAELELAATHRGLTLIRAPFDGIMGTLQARRGSLLSEGDTLTTLADNSKVWVYFNVSETEYLDLQAHHGTNTKPVVKLMLANGQVYKHAGRVETIIADFNPENGTVPFRATFPNPEGLLRHGETGKVLMTLRVQDALLVPKKATFDVLDKKYVYVVDDQHVVKSRRITVSAEQTQLFLVASGLTEKDRIVVEGIRKIHDGSVIAPAFEKPLDVISHLNVPAE